MERQYPSVSDNYFVEVRNAIKYVYLKIKIIPINLIIFTNTHLDFNFYKKALGKIKYNFYSNPPNFAKSDHCQKVENIEMD